jgi:hypothetical protein
MPHGGSSAEADAPVCGTGTHGFDPRLSPEEIWLAGLLEGEGSFLKTRSRPPKGMPTIQIQMTDADVVARVASMWGVTVRVIAGRRTHHKAVHFASLRGNPAVDLMLRISPMMGARRQRQIAAAIEGYETTRRRLRPGERNEIVAALKSGVRATELARRFDISREHVYKLARQATLQS